MAKFQVQGTEEYALMLEKLAQNSPKIAGKAIYAAAGIVADEIKRNIRDIPVRSGYATPKNPAAGLPQKAKDGLLDSMGITTLKNEMGYINVKIGFDGYNKIKTKAHPNGQPNQLVARGVEGGASWLKATPFIKPALRKTRKKAIEAMQTVVDEEIQKQMK